MTHSFLNVYQTLESQIPNKYLMFMMSIRKIYIHIQIQINCSPMCTTIQITKASTAQTLTTTVLSIRIRTSPKFSWRQSRSVTSILQLKLMNVHALRNPTPPLDWTQCVIIWPPASRSDALSYLNMSSCLTVSHLLPTRDRTCYEQHVAMFPVITGHLNNKNETVTRSLN